MDNTNKNSLNNNIKHIKLTKSRNNSTLNVLNSSQINNSRSKSEKEINSKNENETNKYIEQMKKGTYNILVAVRCRPLNQKEKEYSPIKTINILNKNLLILKDPNGINNINNNRSKEISMAFDYIFDENTKQETIFNSTTKFLIEGVINGYNATVFAYGATGAGKTYTMLGNDKNLGIMPLTLKELFLQINSYHNREYNVKMWYLEIYNENIRDLLSNNNENNNLDLREDSNKGIIVSGITEIKATSSEHILNLLKKGNKNRTTESTNANETSSRSHAILQIMVSYKEKNTGIEYEIKYGKLSLIDLAGSERASVTLNRGNRLIEGANINRSLLTLGNCINLLCEVNEKGNKQYIPYRDSKLTRLLKDSLGGNSRTVMIANISPSSICFDDTYNTLNYANRAKKIKSNVKRNVLSAQYHINDYNNIIKSLQNRIFDLENKIGNKRVLTISPTSRRYENDGSCIIEKVKILCEKEIDIQKKIIGNNYEIYKMKKDMFNNDNNNNNNDIVIEKIKKINDLIEKFNGNLKEVNNSIESYSNKIKKLNELERDYVNIIINNNKNKINNFNLAYKIILMKDKIEKLNEYINELDNQIEIRDNILKKRNIIINNELNENYKSLISLRNKYKIKKIEEQKLNITNEFFKSTSNDNLKLPPLSNNSVKSLNKTEVDTVLNNIRDVNNNINKIHIKLKNLDENKSLLRPRSSINIIKNKTYHNESLKKNNKINVKKNSIPKNEIIYLNECKQKTEKKNNKDIKCKNKNISLIKENITDNNSFNIDYNKNKNSVNGKKIEIDLEENANNNNFIYFSKNENEIKEKSYFKLINLNVIRNCSFKNKSPVRKGNNSQKKKLPFKN